MEIPEWLVLPAFSGAIALALSKSWNNKRIDTSEKFIVTAALLGLIPSLIVLAIKNKFNNYIPFSSDVVSLINLIWASGLALLFQYLFTKDVEEINENSTQISNQLEKEIVKTIRHNEISEKNKSYNNLIDHLIELKNGKVYVGQIEYIDIKDTEAIAEKFLSFAPKKSGQRDSHGSVIYNSFYSPDIKAGQTDDEYDKEFTKIAEQIQTVFVPFSEVISIRKFNPIMDIHFGHSTK